MSAELQDLLSGLLTACWSGDKTESVPLAAKQTQRSIRGVIVPSFCSGSCASGFGGHILGDILGKSIMCFILLYTNLSLHWLLLNSRQFIDFGGDCFELGVSSGA